MKEYLQNYIEFDKYAAKVKSSTAGLYDPEYIRLKYNVCLLESNKIISAKKSNKAVEFVVDANKSKVIPTWIEFDKEKLEAKILRKPTREDVDLEVQESLIVELYSKN